MYRCVRCGKAINSGAVCPCGYNITSVPMRFAFPLSVMARDLLSQAVRAEQKRWRKQLLMARNPETMNTARA